MKAGISQAALRSCSLAGLALCLLLAVWGISSGAFASRQAMEELIAGFGPMGAVLFTLFQAVQVVLPILPGGLGCLAGVVLFGPAKGFLYNYIGICTGSILAFALAKTCGRPLMDKLFSPKLMAKYDSWTKEKRHFDRLFALAIFLPIAPDDFLCYLAGTTAMSWKKFIAVILLGKPAAILIYSLLLNTAWEQLLRLV